MECLGVLEVYAVPSVVPALNSDREVEHSSHECIYDDLSLIPGQRPAAIDIIFYEHNLNSRVSRSSLFRPEYLEYKIVYVICVDYV